MTPDRAVDALGVLVEPQRRRLYERLLTVDGGLSRAELGQTLGLSRTLVSFHLAKLCEAGLVTPLAPGGSAGRRGRPAQQYQACVREVLASVPARRYEVIAEVLLEAAADGGRAGQDVSRVARRRGAELAAAGAGKAEPAGPRRRAGTAAGLTHVAPILTAAGYVPRREPGRLLLSNCPFDQLRQVNLELVCRINQALVQGCLDALGLAGRLEARVEPAPQRCCVVIQPG